jgi:hypothetical protein
VHAVYRVIEQLHGEHAITILCEELEEAKLQVVRGGKLLQT